MTKKTELLGKKVRCLVTGFEGIAESKHIYLNGCVRYGVVPRIKEGGHEMPKTYTVDVEQLIIIDNGVNQKIEAQPSGGGKRHFPERD